jgi:hypothetical protein
LFPVPPIFNIFGNNNVIKIITKLTVINKGGARKEEECGRDKQTW